MAACAFRKATGVLSVRALKNSPRSSKKRAVRAPSPATVGARTASFFTTSKRFWASTGLSFSASHSPTQASATQQSGCAASRSPRARNSARASSIAFARSTTSAAAALALG